MNRLMQWVMAAALICSSTVFTGCSKSGSDDVQEPVVKPDPVVNPDPDDNGANSGSDEIGYIECSWDGTKVVKTPKVVAAKNIIDQPEKYGGQTHLESGAYYVSGTHDYNGSYEINGGKKVDIILCDGAELKVKHIYVEGEGTRLRIFAQDKGTGKLTAKPTGSGASYPAIGPAGDDGCYLEFHGGNIIAEGRDGTGYGAPGIGCGTDDWTESYPAFDRITIYDGTINAKGGNDCAGIGNTQRSPYGFGDVYIYGGNVTAQGGEYAAGIGGGDNNRIGSINIYGGTVTAYSGVDGAGIGSGEDGESGDINIYGGVVRAYGDRNASGSHKGYGAGIGSGQDGSVNTIIIKGGDVQAFGGMDAAGIGTGEEYTGNIISGTIEIHGGKVWAEGKGYGAGIGCGEDATFGVLGISGGRVDAHAGSDCGPWSGGIGAYHKDHGADDNCHIGWAGWQRIYIGKGMRLWTYSPNVGGVENVTNNQPWWNYVHQRPQVAFGECDHPGYTEATCPFCYRETLQLQ